MMELYQIDSGRLDAYIADHLQSSEEFRQNARDAVDRICSFLKENCKMDAKVIKTVKGGSTAKGTTLEDNSDVDLVIFLSCFSSYQDQAENRESVISTIGKNLYRCWASIAFKVDIVHTKSKGRPPRSLSLLFQSRKKKEAVEVDILPAYDVLGQIIHPFKPSPEVYRDLIKFGGEPGEFNTSFTELQRDFVKVCPVKCKSLLRLVKHWYKECKKKLREASPSLSLPPKFALELLTIYAWEEGTTKAEKFNTAEGFCTVMKLITQYQYLCLYWTMYYDLEDSIIGEHVKEKLKGPRPVIMDPADPTGNVAKGNGWDLLAKEAAICQEQSCCLKLNQHVKSWDVQPAKSIRVTVTQLGGANCVLICSPYDTIWKIKEAVRNEWQFSTCDLRLALPGPGQETIILQDDKTFADYGVFYDTKILLLHTRPQEIEIFVKDLKGKSLLYTILPNQMVLDLKKKIETRLNIPVNQQRLTYQDKELNDTNTLASYNMRSKDTVYLLLRLRGGHTSFTTASL